jgi:hypothetical protein
MALSGDSLSLSYVDSVGAFWRFGNRLRKPNVFLIDPESVINRTAISALLIVALQSPLRASIDDVSYGFLTPDTRNLALGWVEENVLPGKFILREWGTPEIERASSSYRVHYTGFPFEEATLAEWKARGVDFVMISAERYDFYRDHAADFKDVLVKYDRLKIENSLLQTFEAGPGVKGPPVYIYSLN